MPHPSDLFSSTQIITVSYLNRIVRQLLETEMTQIWLSGEISNFSQPASGHWYFTLKDDKAQIRCAMFKMANLHVSFHPQNGQHVVLKANVTLYEPRGDYQLIVEQLQMAGAGSLQQQFEQLKARLQAEGLFNLATKKTLPKPTQQLGIITSASGAALRDILQILRRRDPALPIIIYPTLVQGKDAAKQIANAILLANQRAECDVLIIARGGGSLEDLWCFNDEQVARAIFASQIPIISAVGHETDITIADFVADLRAPTPSAGAEIVSRDRVALQTRLAAQLNHLSLAMDYYLSQKNHHWQTVNYRLSQQHPSRRLARQRDELLSLHYALSLTLRQAIYRYQQRLQQLQRRLLQQSPYPFILRQQQTIKQYEHQLQQQFIAQLTGCRQRFSIACSQLNAVSPLATLERGYSITTLTDGTLVTDVKKIKAGDKLQTQLAKGQIISHLIETIT